LLPGVIAGSFIGAWLGRSLKLEGFKDGYNMTRYIAGAILMGFGSMLAGGCAVGPSMTDGAIFAADRLDQPVGHVGGGCGPNGPAAGQPAKPWTGKCQPYAPGQDDLTPLRLLVAEVFSHRSHLRGRLLLAMASMTALS
jgi:hypothetical protein